MFKSAFNSHKKLINSNIQIEIGKILDNYHGIQIFDTKGADPDSQFVVLYVVRNTVILAYNTKYNYLELVVNNNKVLHDQLYDQFVIADPEVEGCYIVK